MFSVDDKNIANPKEIHDHMYSNNAAASSAIMQASKSYTAVLASYENFMNYSGKITLDSDHPMIIQPLPDESNGYSLKTIEGEWSFHNSGGCGNFDTYGKNPAYCF